MNVSNAAFKGGLQSKNWDFECDCKSLGNLALRHAFFIVFWLLWGGCFQTVFVAFKNWDFKGDGKSLGNLALRHAFFIVFCLLWGGVLPGGVLVKGARFQWKRFRVAMCDDVEQNREFRVAMEEV